MNQTDLPCFPFVSFIVHSVGGRFEGFPAS